MLFGENSHNSSRTCRLSYVKTAVVYHILNLPLRGSLSFLCVLKIITEIKIIFWTLLRTWVLCVVPTRYSIYHASIRFHLNPFFSITPFKSFGRTGISQIFNLPLCSVSFQLHFNIMLIEIPSNLAFKKKLAITSHSYFTLYPTKELLLTMRK